MFLFAPVKTLMLQASNNAMGVATGTSETSLFPSVVGDRQIPANWFTPGSNARFVLRGSVTTPLVAGTTMIKVKIGGNTIATATTTSLLGSLTGASFAVIGNLQCYTAGTNATFGLGGVVNYPTGLLGFGAGAVALNATNITFDSTVPQMLDVTTQWTIASHVINVNIATLELMPA